jgi:riboflavin kinase
MVKNTERERKALRLEGTVFSGLGEGQHYVGIPGYLRQFEDKLGFSPFPGTLNLRITSSSLKYREELDKRPAIVIQGFSDGKRVFGSGRCYPADIAGIQAAVVIPERTHYPSDLIEILAPVKLREALGLKNGDQVTVIVDIRPQSSEDGSI